MRSSSILAAAAAVLAFASSASADVITDWNGTSIEVLRSRSASPNEASRAIAITHLAAYDAVVAITKTYEPYLPGLKASLPASAEAAAAQAAYETLLALYPEAKSALDKALDISLKSIEDGKAEDNGIQLGKAAAAAILKARQSDHAGDSVAHDPSTAPGKWRETAPGFAAAAEPHWATVTPFALETPNQFRPAPPPALDSLEYTLAFTAVKLSGSATSSFRTEAQTATAKFWEQETYLPFFGAARALAKREKLELDESARLFAALSLAIADSRIATWDAKYTYSYWRPITAITTVPVPGNDDGGDVGTGGQGGAESTDTAGEETEGIEDDGNPETVADPDWLPYLTTPNYPAYVSAHSATGAAAAAVLAHWFGDETVFTVGSDTAAGYTRTFQSFSDAAEENAVSRVYGGVNFDFSNEAGLALGTEVANYVLDNYLLEVDAGQGGDGQGGSSGGKGGSAGSGGKGGSAGKGGSGGTSSTGEAGADAGGEGGAADEPAKGSGGTKNAPVKRRNGDDSGCSVSAAGKTGNAAGLLAAVAALGLALARRRP